MAQIFISYRRQDSAYLAAILSEKLQQHFGPNSVFLDVDNIPFGVDFREYIGNAVGQCDVLLVIIGEQWMGPTEQGKRRIDDPTDFMRVEIESALKRNIPVIPVLVEAATMPAPDNLPPAIQSIAFRNAAEIRAGRDLRQHIDQLINGLETLFKLSPTKTKPATGGPIGPEGTADYDEKSRATKPTARKKSADAGRRRTVKKVRDSELPEKSVGALDKASRQYEELMAEIQKALNGYTDSYLYVGEAIPADKLASAIKAYAPGVSPVSVLLLFDNTVFGGAKDGLLLTRDAVYWHNISSKPGKISYSDLTNVEFRESTSIFTAAKVAINQDQIDFNMGDKNKVAMALVNVIRNLKEYATQD